MHFRYDNLTQCYKGINQSILSEELPCNVVSSHSIIEPLVIDIAESKMTIPLKYLGYTDYKLKLLRSAYVNEQDWVDFLQGIESLNRTKEKIFYFKQKPDYAGKPRPNCLILISYNKAHDCYTVIWRTTELGARFGADLWLLSHLLPGKRLILMINHGYQELSVLPGIVEMLGLRYKVKKNPPFIRVYERSREKYFGTPMVLYESWRPIYLVQKNLLEYRKGKL